MRTAAAAGMAPAEVGFVVDEGVPPSPLLTRLGDTWTCPPFLTPLGDTWTCPPLLTPLGDTWTCPPFLTPLGDTCQVLGTSQKKLFFTSSVRTVH